MMKFALSLGIGLLLTQAAMAQSYCEQVRQGVAQYGYSSAKRYAIAHYGREAARRADQCLSKGKSAKKRSKTRRG
jgi:hypothetical protein